MTNRDMSYSTMLLQLTDNHIKQRRSYGDDTGGGVSSQNFTGL